ncbi:hypothetical protein HP467_01035 [Curtobacterium albidum]|uniref:Uncharacterized protein n=1 Tax=Curtobacterium citreum TaxID=2036 RepID=A0A850DT76_9MICO|nr:hypothetical protein [Curtobacterium albidum]NUU26703.1 hypothetical protein [Curtobacterium albidum]
MPREITILGPTLVGDAEFRPAAAAVDPGIGLRLVRGGLVGRFTDADGRFVATVQHPRRVRSVTEVRRLLPDLTELPPEAEGGGWWWTDVLVPLHDDAGSVGTALAEAIADHAHAALSTQDGGPR